MVVSHVKNFPQIILVIFNIFIKKRKKKNGRFYLKNETLFEFIGSARLKNASTTKIEAQPSMRNEWSLHNFWFNQCEFQVRRLFLCIWSWLDTDYRINNQTKYDHNIKLTRSVLLIYFIVNFADWIAFLIRIHDLVVQSRAERRLLRPKSGHNPLKL